MENQLMKDLFKTTKAVLLALLIVLVLVVIHQILCHSH